MNTLESLMKEYKECQDVLDQNLEGLSPFNQSMKMRQADCRDRVQIIEREYMAVLKERAFTIFLEGKPEDQIVWAKIATDEANVMCLSADSFYKKLAEHVEPTLGDRRTFGTSQLATLIRALGEIGRDVGARQVPTPQIFETHHLKGEAAVVNYLREIVRASSGDSLNLLWIEKEILMEGLKIKYSRSVVPVIVLQATPEEVKELAPNLFSRVTFTVKIKEAPTKEVVLQRLTEIRQTLKQRKQSTFNP